MPVTARQIAITMRMVLLSNALDARFTGGTFLGFRRETTGG
jgi:hypothetical protein